MEYSLIEDVDNYIKENGLIEDTLYFSINRLPNYIRKVLIEEGSKSSIKSKIDPFVIYYYDKNKEPAIIVTFNEGKSSLLITNSKEHYEFHNEDFKFTKIKEKTIYQKSALKEVRNNIGKKIELNTEALFDSVDSELIRKHTLSTLDIIENELLKGDKVFDYSNIEKDLRGLSDHIKAYALEMDRRYKEEVDYNEIMDYLDEQERQKNEEENKIITFYKDDSSTAIHSINNSNASRSYNISSTERANDIMNIYDREKLLIKFFPLYRNWAKCNNNEEDYACYLYPLGINEYELILEPVNGEKYTKLIRFNTDDRVSKMDFNKIAEKYLTLSEDELLHSGFCARIAHTSKEVYDNSISYALTFDDNYQISQYLKLNIDSLVPDYIKLQELSNENQKTLN